jgi:hypothetical protein
MTIKKSRLRLLLGLFALLMVSIIIGSQVTAQYRRIDSPDGRHYAVARYYLYEVIIPKMPGSGGDKSGHITVYSKDGQSCGRVPVSLVSSIDDLRWGSDEAVIPALATWYLQKRLVDRWRH